MKAKRLGVVAVIAVAMGIVAAKAKRRSEAAERSSVQAASSSVGTSVVLVADLGEADAPCVCGQIIRSVRTASIRGVPTREVDPASSPNLAASYGVRVTPAVLLLDGRGKELRRFEGESAATLTTVQAELDRLPTRAP